MKTKLFCSALAVLVSAFTFPARAQQAGKMPTIGWISPLSLKSDGPPESVSRQFHALGYVEGKNIANEFRYADNKLDRLPALAEELIGLKVDVLVASSTLGALAAQSASRTIPIVFYNVTDPIAAGLVENLSRPGRNLTGFTNVTVELAGKRLELLKETTPKLSRIAVLWDPRGASSTLQWKESQLSARALGVQLYSMEVSSADRYESALKEALNARSEALAVTDHALAAANRKQIADLAIKYRLPAIYGRGDFVESDGGLMSYGADPDEIYRRAAVLVDKILKGAKPADIPVERPMRFEFNVNLKAAKQIGLTIPPNVLVRAGKVIR